MPRGFSFSNEKVLNIVDRKFIFETTRVTFQNTSFILMWGEFVATKSILILHPCLVPCFSSGNCVDHSSILESN